MQYVNFVAGVNHYVNFFYLCCGNGCALLWWNVECCSLQRKKSQECEWWDIIVKIDLVGSLYWWCGAILCLVSFVDQIIQLKLVGEYYVKSFVKTIAWFAIMCMCHSKGTFSFSVRRRRRWERRAGGGSSSGLWQGNPLAVGDGDSE